MNPVKQLKIRPLTRSDQEFLWEMLYQSLYLPAGGAPFEREILNNQDIARYVNDWGRANDCGFVAVDEKDRPVGAIWLRLFKGDEKGFGYVDDETPELAMAVATEYRGQGIGTQLLSSLIKSAESCYEHICLSVAIGNPALRLYEKMGFEVVGKRGDSITMKKKCRTR